jgi:hypothetical protein
VGQSLQPPPIVPTLVMRGGTPPAYGSMGSGLTVQAHRVSRPSARHVPAGQRSSLPCGHLRLLPQVVPRPPLLREEWGRVNAVPPLGEEEAPLRGTGPTDPGQPIDAHHSGGGGRGLEATDSSAPARLRNQRENSRGRARHFGSSPSPPDSEPYPRTDLNRCTVSNWHSDHVLAVSPCATLREGRRPA